MRRATAVLLAGLLGGGCLPVSKRGGWALVATGAVVSVVGGGVAAESDGELTHGTLATGVLPGVIILAVGLFFVIENDDSSAEEPTQAGHTLPWEDERVRQQREAAKQQREAAWQLTKEAQAAARADNCARVIEIDPNVQAMDSELYASTFITDVAIQRCLGSPVPASR